MLDLDPAISPTEPVEVLLGLGANLGDRRAQLDRAVREIEALPGVDVVAVSSWRETAPVGGPPQGDYLNGAVRLRSDLSARTLLELCKRIELAAGRDLEAPRNAPRPLDIDILLYGDARIDARDLRVPHPRMHERAFVLDPLRELGLPVDDPAFVAGLTSSAGPQVIEGPSALQAWCAARRRDGCRLGLVPTMGALHEGHVSLLEQARAECDRVVATIFVNPLQFGAHEDLGRYPRTFAADLAACRTAGVDVVFAPREIDMYPPGFCSRVAVGAEAEGLEGGQRSGHFAGVATVVARLWSLAMPDRAYFGQKDAQQVAVLRRLAADLGLSGELVECPIVREPDGLALSSRNVYLAAEDRQAATVLSRALRAAQRTFDAGTREAAALLDLARHEIDAEPRAALDYLELRSADFAGLGEGPVVAGARLLVAARFGEPVTRLLDNVVLGEAPIDAAPEAGA